jgi:D-glycero-D-manno-heptose 1,7-bisphosphate phosphatase
VTRAAVFLDRDGTIIRDEHYLADPDGVVLLPGAGRAIQRLNKAELPVVVVTNQSGIARGMLNEAQFEQVTARLDQLLAATGARIDATYMCPHHPDYTGACECRKPGTLLYQRAARDLGLDLEGSWYIGDKLRDVSPARALGGHGILVPSADTPAEDISASRPDIHVASSLDAAVTFVIESAHE